MSGRVFALLMIATIAVSVAADNLARATMPAPKPGKLAEPQSTNQVGFPAQLYHWDIPADNPETPAKIALGKALFFDPRLSVDNTVACANCHDPDEGFTDHMPTSMGVHGKF
jgi:cytochrome c peroxidase